MSTLVITPELMRLKQAQEQQLRDDAEADAREREYLAQPVLCATCGDRASDLYYTQWRKDEDGYRHLSCSCGAQKYVE